jgi:hypothetical protein
MKKSFFTLFVCFIGLFSFAQNKSEKKITIIKIDTTVNGQIDTLIFNFDSNTMDLSKWEDMLKDMDIDIDLNMDFNDSLPNFDFNFDSNQDFLNFDFFGSDLFPFGNNGIDPQDNSAKIGITPSKSFKGTGVMVETVTPISLGAALGLQTGDVIVELNGIKIQSFPDLKAQLELYKVGDEAQITFTRAGKKKKVSGFFIPVSNMNIQRDIRISRP